MEFCKNARYLFVRFESTEDGDMGKILNGEELQTFNLTDVEIHRSAEYQNDDRLFVLDLLPSEERYVVNNIQLLIDNLFEARTIEMVYPGIFRWVYDGLSVKGYAIVPSGDPKSHSTITRYGGTDQFIKILRQHLNNIAKLRMGKTPNYVFLTDTYNIEETEISIGSVNKQTGTYSVDINIKDDSKKIMEQSNNNTQVGGTLKHLNMKYWTKEINPDFITEAKRIKLKKTLKLEEDHFKYYPQPIKALMNLPTKGNYNRFLLAKFLLSVYSPIDAKFVYYSVLGNEELEHVQKGNCSTQWNYILNNMKRYSCPTNKELAKFIDKNVYKLSHPLEEIQKLLGEEDGD